ncbi:NAD(P)-binding protein [Dactylosporangium sp. AC04546]|uniref:potassium channel family protein n=1 Tax=Dactylosporangium sp. AC04546 TaxID=2862460 RepID=UPI001EDF4495|nr:NAD(P)-binding protein [Dactylosporangium sp. AC04546]WVK84677.1 NAD(P)-binding protein [Dactylosporangium sp. AC04546]
MRKFVVWGDNALARRLVGELINTYSAQVTVIVPSLTQNQAPEIAAIHADDDPGHRPVLIEARAATTEVFEAADLTDADAIAFVDADDVANVDAALVAREVDPHVRVVLRMFNTVLGAGVTERLVNCAVLSASEIAAPAFVAAALGDNTPTSIRLSDGQQLMAVDRAEANPSDVRAGLAVTAEAESLPADDERADLVLVSVYGKAKLVKRRRRRRHPLRASRLLFSGGLRRVLLVALGVLTAGTVAVGLVRHVSPWRALYLTLLTALGGADPNLQDSVLVQAVSLALVLAGVALIPALTAAIVGVVVKARLAIAAGGLAEPVSDHVVVVGLGNIGTRVLRELHDQGIDVVGVDRNEQARGVQVARDLGIPVIIGSANSTDTLRAASVATARCLVAVTTADVNNLEAALIGRDLARQADPAKQLRVVLRLFEEDFARRIKQAFDINLSRSVSYLAAPAFAASMVGSEVIDTIPVGRRVLLVAEVPVGAGSRLEGQYFRDVSEPGLLRLVAVQTGRPGMGVGVQTFWAPEQSRWRTLDRTQTMIVVATRAGLVALLERAAGVENPPPFHPPSAPPLLAPNPRGG